MFLFKQETAYEMRISDWNSDVCSSDLVSSSKARAISARTRAILDHNPTPTSSNRATRKANNKSNKAGGTNRNRSNSTDQAKMNNNSPRSEASHVGQECAGTMRSRWWAYTTKKIK